MTYRVRTNTGCNHRSDEPCSRCWYESQRGGHFQGALPVAVLSPFVMPGFPEGTVYEHAFAAWEQPHPVSSREELRQLCNRQGVTANYLRDSTVWRSGEQRWI